MVVVMENGYQTALMAPTEILAEQHLRTLSRYLRGTDHGLALLTGRVRGKRRREILERIRSGDVRLVIGTHALIEAPVRFRDLGLAVIDEQHRFGVLQRSRFMGKGESARRVDHDGHADSQEPGPDGLRRPGPFGAGRASPRPAAGQDGPPYGAGPETGCMIS